jgi:hypothetical protein
VPTQVPDDWRGLLAQPDLHWKAGYSAMTLANAWETADGLPREVRAALDTAPELRDLEPLLIIPEYKVALPGGRRESRYPAPCANSCCTVQPPPSSPRVSTLRSPP